MTIISYTYLIFQRSNCNLSTNEWTKKRYLMLKKIKRKKNCNCKNLSQIKKIIEWKVRWRRALYMYIFCTLISTFNFYKNLFSSLDFYCSIQNKKSYIFYPLIFPCNFFFYLLCRDFFQIVGFFLSTIHKALYSEILWIKKKKFSLKYCVWIRLLNDFFSFEKTWIFNLSKMQLDIKCLIVKYKTNLYFM